MNFFGDLFETEPDIPRPTTSKQQSSNEKIQNVLSEMMFANGDAVSPNSECVVFMQELMKEQLLIAMERASEQARSRNERGEFKYSDLLHGMCRHPNFVCRLIKYASDRLTLVSLSSSFGETSSESVEFHHYRHHTDIEELVSAFRTSDQTGNLSRLIEECLEPNYVDHVKQARQFRISEISNKMDERIYTQFSKARRRCLCYTNDRHVSKSFIDWIGKSNMDSHSVLILNFMASEIVAQMVENACLVRAEDFKYNNKSSSENICPLELFHYKNALRRNLGYQMNGNLLFGYADVSA